MISPFPQTCAEVFGHIILAVTYLPDVIAYPHTKHNMNNLVDRTGITFSCREQRSAGRCVPCRRRGGVHRSDGAQIVETPAGHQQEVPADHRGSRVSTHSGIMS
jgi:hypothetical protein